jgi:hypothetical protein
MKGLYVALVLVLVAQKGMCEPTTKEIAVAEKIARQLGKGEFESVCVNFDSDLKTTLKAAQIQKAYVQLTAQIGAVGRVIRSIKGSAQGFDVVDVLCATKNAGMIVRVAFDNEGLVGGLWILPTASPSPLPAVPGEKERKEQELAAAEKIARQLGKDQFDAAREKFDAVLKSSLTADNMQLAWSALVGQVGEYDRVVKSSHNSDQGLDIVEVLCASKQAGILVRVQFDSSGLVGGLWVMPTASPATERDDTSTNAPITPTFP